jgi:ubiquinone/menaquinone biosynthesis C-methylase UbiE
MVGPFAHAAGYDRLTRRPVGRLHARIVADIAAAELAPSSRILDAGTGPGRLPQAIATALPHVTVDGVDLAPDMIEYARREATAAGLADRITFTVGDVAHLPYPDMTFDLIVSSLSQHHWVDVEDALRDLHRVLRPGGRLWIYDARFALRRATAAARAVFPTASVRREPARRGWLPIRLVARLTAQA